MKRRTLLKSVLALPVAAQATSMTPSAMSPTTGAAPDALYSGLPGLDYAMGGLEPGQLSCFMGPPCMGKTMLLLELAARLVARYGQNVYFHGAHQPSVFFSRKISIRDDTRIYFAEIRNFVDDYDQGDKDPGVVLLDSQSDPAPLALKMVSELSRSHPGGCAALIMDGWSTYRPRSTQENSPLEIGVFPAERWPHGVLSTEILAHVLRVGADLEVPIVLGVTNASLMDNMAQSESFEIETQLRIRLDHLVSLHRPEIYRETAQRRPEEQNVVCLTGTSPLWWDTRCSRLRFDPRKFGFSTVV
jgi:hypothetical protein